MKLSVTARDFAETVALAHAAGFEPEVIGGHGGGKLSGKAGNLIQRAMALGAMGTRSQFRSGAQSQFLFTNSGRARVSLKTVTLMDYEHQPANHLAFRLASRIIVPRAFPEDALRRFGANLAKVRRYNGTKEDVYLADFQRDPEFEKNCANLGSSQTTFWLPCGPRPAKRFIIVSKTNCLNS